MMNPENLKKGQEQFVQFFRRAKKKFMIQYDFRNWDGVLFSCVDFTLEKCRDRKDKWLVEQYYKKAEERQFDE